MHIEAIDHLHIYCDNPQQSAAFYQQHLSAQWIMAKQSPDGRERVILDIAGHVIVLGHFPDHFSAQPQAALPPEAYAQGLGLAHFGVKVRSVAQAQLELSQNNVVCIDAPKREGITQQFFIKAPDGVFIEVSEY